MILKQRISGFNHFTQKEGQGRLTTEIGVFGMRLPFANFTIYLNNHERLFKYTVWIE